MVWGAARGREDRAESRDVAVSAEEALDLLADVKDGFGKGQGIPTTGIVGVGVWILLVLRFTIFYGFFGE